LEFEWDEAKAASNLAKHGLSFEIAYGFDWESSPMVLDLRFDYGEARYLAFGPATDGKKYVVAFTFRGAACRIISVRPFGRKEHRIYGGQT
jgi:uncharacterized DUF497 family protein